MRMLAGNQYIECDVFKFSCLLLHPSCEDPRQGVYRLTLRHACDRVAGDACERVKLIRLWDDVIQLIILSKFAVDEMLLPFCAVRPSR